MIGILTLPQEPLRYSLHKITLAIVLTEFTYDERHLLRDWKELILPAGGIRAVVEVIDVRGSCQLV